VTVVGGSLPFFGPLRGAVDEFEDAVELLLREPRWERYGQTWHSMSPDRFTMSMEWHPGQKGHDSAHESIAMVKCDTQIRFGWLRWKVTLGVRLSDNLIRNGWNGFQRMSLSSCVYSTTPMARL
jgi:hypothetical protein